jgi:hypothetical protein
MNIIKKKKKKDYGGPLPQVLQMLKDGQEDDSIRGGM